MINKTFELKEVDWEPIKIDELFDVSKGTYLNSKKIKNGNIPYITAKSVDNGLNSFIGNSPQFNGNTITIEKIKLSAYFQPKAYYCSHDVSVLSHKKINKYSGLFIASIISRQGVKYSYGRQAQMNVVKRETAFLPVKHNKPDWAFMEGYTKNIIEKRKNKYKKHCIKILETIEYKSIVPLNEKKWKEFFLRDIFSFIQRGKRLTKVKQIKGVKPYISSTATNNGVDNFINNTDKVRVFSNCITLANSGSVGSSFYHSYDFVASDHVTHLKNDLFNKYTYLFISSILRTLSNKYNFNREINDRRISREKIILPITNANKPDYEYMEQYIKNIEYMKRKKYLDYINKK